MWTDALRFLLSTVFGFIVYSALLRFMMQWLRAPFRNPVGQAVIALTDWAVKPLRRVLSGRGGYDWASLVIAWVAQMLWLVALSLLAAVAFTGGLVGMLAAVAIVELIKAGLWIMIIAVFLQAILSWVAPDGPLAGVLNAMTFRVLAPIRRVVPPIGGTLDISPLIAIVVAQLILMLPVAWLEQSVGQVFR